MVVTALGLNLTRQCNARCAHCACYCGPGVRDWISLADAREYLGQLAGEPRVLALSGGEPGLDWDLTVAVAREATRHGIPEVWVFTNGFWAISLPAALEVVTRLGEAGVTRLCLSASVFHRPFVPVASVKNALQAGRRGGLDLVLDLRYLPGPGGVAVKDPETTEILEQLGDLSDVEVWEGTPRLIGRAAERLAPAFPGRDRLPAGSCPGPWVIGTLAEPAGIDVDPAGDVTLCPGLSIGNALRRPLSAIVRSYDAGHHPIVREIVAGGPRKLARLAQTLGWVPPDESFVTACHLCFTIRRFLRPYYPDVIAPAGCYGEPL
ncbi:radical SAM protein [Candidatus Bipolaricaulota bacterium]|nr:radical SAM protein [Candidatus Bipolaricaulota bacterium]